MRGYKKLAMLWPRLSSILRPALVIGLSTASISREELCSVPLSRTGEQAKKKKPGARDRHVAHSKRSQSLASHLLRKRLLLRWILLHGLRERPKKPSFLRSSFEKSWVIQLLVCE